MIQEGMRVRVRYGVSLPLRWYRLDGSMVGPGLISEGEFTVMLTRAPKLWLAPTLVMLDSSCGYYNAACFEPVP